MRLRAGLAGTALALAVTVALTACAPGATPAAPVSPSALMATTVPSATMPASPLPSAPSAASVYEAARDRLLAVEAARGPSAALAELDRMSADPVIAGVCHALAHDLGHAAIARLGTVAKALRYRDDVCGGGYVHGVIEVVLGRSRHPARDLLTVCAPAQDGSCFHGVGHGLMFATGMNVARSLRLCDQAPSSILSSRCGEGVFMQLFGGDTAGSHAGHGPTPTPQTALADCDTVSSRYAPNCYFYAPTSYLLVTPDDFAGALQWCRGSVKGAQMCARGVGSRTVKYHPDDLSVGAAACAGAGSLLDSCLAGMGSYWSVHRKGSVPPRDVCRRLGDADLARRCRAVT